MKRIISTDKAPGAVGPYSQAVEANGLLFCSGQIPLRPDGSMVEGGVAEQTTQCLDNLMAVLAAREHREVPAPIREALAKMAAAAPGCASAVKPGEGRRCIPTPGLRAGAAPAPWPPPRR